MCWIRATGGAWRLCCHPVPVTLLHQQADVAVPGAMGTWSRKGWATTSNLCLPPAALTRDQDHTQRSRGNRHRQVPWQSFSVKPKALFTVTSFLDLMWVSFLLQHQFSWISLFTHRRESNRTETYLKQTCKTPELGGGQRRAVEWEILPESFVKHE